VVPESGVGWGRGALVVEDDFGNAFFLGDSMHSPTRLPRITRKTSNMPQLLTNFRFLNGYDATDIQSGS